jgi:hypothetical protein
LFRIANTWHQQPAALSPRNQLVLVPMPFEFAEVNVCFPIRGLPPPAQEWKPISNEAGDKMVIGHVAVVHASTKPRPHGPKRYSFACASDDGKVVKYLHCVQQHRRSPAILVRKSQPYSIQVSCHRIEAPDQFLITARSASDNVDDDNEILWTSPFTNGADITIGDVCPSITEEFVSKNRITRQSKIVWRVQGKTAKKTMKLITKKKDHAARGASSGQRRVV